MEVTSDLQIDAAHKMEIDALWAKQRHSMNDAVFLRHVLSEAEEWDLGHGDEDRVITYVKELMVDRWVNVRPRLSVEIDAFFTGWIAEVMKEYERCTFIPNKQLSRIMDIAEKEYRNMFYRMDTSHPEEWNMVRSWLWGKAKNHKHPVEKGMKILWPVAMAYDKDGKPVKGGPYRMDAIEFDHNAERPKEVRFRAILCYKRPYPRKETDRIVGGINEDGIICICQQHFSDKIIGFELIGFTRNGTACFVKPIYGKKGDKHAVFREYAVEI
jgi:hypothetical protein